MDVTEQVLYSHRVYGGSDSTRRSSLAGSKSLNYANGASIQKPIEQYTNRIPCSLPFKGEIGWYGAENIFIRVDLSELQEYTATCYLDNTYECATVDYNYFDLFDYYEVANIYDDDIATVNTYEAATINENKLPVNLYRPYVSVELTNLKTQNKYIDRDVSVRLYTKDKEEHPYDYMYIPSNGYFYIGIHGRNTKKLSYNIECYIGEEYKSLNNIEERKYIMNYRPHGPHY